MNEKTEILVCLGAATAANCAPCFEYYVKKAHAAGLDSEDVQEAVERGNQMKKGAGLAMKKSITDMLDGKEHNDQPCICSVQSETTCC